MSKPSRVPTYRRHKQSGQAIVTLPDGLGNRRDVLLGQYGTAESRKEYARVIAEWEASGRQLPQSAAEQVADLTVNELLLRYWKHAEGYYRKNGEPTSQLERVRLSLKPVKALYGHTAAKVFGPLALKAVRERMVQNGWRRGYVNSCVGCVKRMFKWAVENELVPASVYHGLQAVPGLKKGRSLAKETERVRPVADDLVDAVLPHLLPPVRAMVQVQRLSGMRPCEVILMRPCDVDRSRGKTWVYCPESHKTEHHDITRAIFLGPQAQEVIKPFLDGRAPGAYLFSPREATEAYLAGAGRNVHHGRKREPGNRYTTCSYDHAVRKACDRAFPPPEHLRPRAEPGKRPESREAFLAGLTPEQKAELAAWRKAHRWAPNQLRHTKATEIRREAGLDAARAVLGHRSASMTETYAELDASKASQVMEKLG
jgi:integrase